jgi:DNA primase
MTLLASDRVKLRSRLRRHAWGVPLWARLLHELEPPALTPAEVIERLQTLDGDPWETMASLDQRITRDHESSLAQARHRTE